MTSIRRSTRHYEDWLGQQLHGDVVGKDLKRKHEKMRDSPFAFLRATYWRWAETVLEICPELAQAPHVLAVGDIHLENFGTWRDADGRLVWGVNDFDEAAAMPYVLDVVRLATSAALAHTRRGMRAADSCEALLAGYRKGLKCPGPIVLERNNRWLRKLVVVREGERKDFWKDIDEDLEATKDETVSARYRKAVADAMPAPALQTRFARRIAGAGSLGRPRWMGIAAWRGAPVIREVKALVMSAWNRAHNPDVTAIRCAEVAGGRHRAPDPWYAVTGAIVARRLSPNNRKIEADDPAFLSISTKVIKAMGRELASVHLGQAGSRPKAIKADLDRRPRGWLVAASQQMADAITRDYEAFGGRRA